MVPVPEYRLPGCISTQVRRRQLLCGPNGSSIRPNKRLLSVDVLSSLGIFKETIHYFKVLNILPLWILLHHSSSCFWVDFLTFSIIGSPNWILTPVSLSVSLTWWFVGLIRRLQTSISKDPFIGELWGGGVIRTLISVAIELTSIQSRLAALLHLYTLWHGPCHYAATQLPKDVLGHDPHQVNNEAILLILS
jgi:hypothetical protein